jgi:hypothetical protein
VPKKPVRVVADAADEGTAEAVRAAELSRPTATADLSSNLLAFQDRITVITTFIPS